MQKLYTRAKACGENFLEKRLIFNEKQAPIPSQIESEEVKKILEESDKNNNQLVKDATNKINEVISSFKGKEHFALAKVRDLIDNVDFSERIDEDDEDVGIISVNNNKIDGLSMSENGEFSNFISELKEYLDSALLNEMTPEENEKDNIKFEKNEKIWSSNFKKIQNDAEFLKLVGYMELYLLIKSICSLVFKTTCV